MGSKLDLQTANTRFNDTLLRMINELEEQNPLVLPEGEYVWKKSKKYTVSFTQEGTTGVYQCISDDIDLSTVSEDWFIGTTGTINTSTEYEFQENNVFKGTSAGLTYSYDPTTQKMTISYGSAGTRTMSDGVKDEFIDYVVSNDSSAYPDGAEQDGYWYERADQLTPEMFGFTKIAIDKIVFSSRTKVYQYNLEHSLGDVPKVAIFQPLSAQTPVAYDVHRIVFNNVLGKSANNMNYASSLAYYNSSKQLTCAQMAYTTASMTNTYVNSSDADEYFPAGIEFALITMV